jgi:hypothetical protein
MQAARFSRTAIVGAFWAPLFFIAFVPMFTVYSVPAGQFHGPAWWQYLLMFTLLPLGLAAPFGTTILGSVALTQIRHSAGKLYGLGLALFDVLLFPLLALDALIGGFWLLLFRAFAGSTGGYLQPTPVNVFLATLVAAIIIDIMIIRWAWRAANKPVGDEVPGGTAPVTTVPRTSRMKFGVIIGLVIAAVAALFFWTQQPRMIDERTIAADSPDEMFSAMGQTWHSMRIMGGDRTFYRFIVWGRAGAVFESWEVPVPTEKLATSYAHLSLDEVLFGKHGKIVWSDDGKRASFQVKGIEVAGFDTESGKPTPPLESIHPTPSDTVMFGPLPGSDGIDEMEQTARAFMTAIRDGDFDAATKWMSPELKAHVGTLEIFEGGSERLNEAYPGLFTSGGSFPASSFPVRVCDYLA